MSDEGDNERRCAMLHVEGHGDDIYGAHNYVLVVKVAASTERVELHDAKPQAGQ